MIAAKRKGREDIRCEVESLLSYHESTSESNPSDLRPLSVAFEPTKANAIQAGIQRLLQKKVIRFALLLGIMLVLLAAASAGRNTLHAILKREVAGHMDSILNSNFLSIELWSEHRTKEVERWAEALGEQPALRELLRISRTSQNPYEEIRSAPAQAEIQKLFASTLRAGPFGHFVIVDDTYRAVSCDVDKMVGNRFLPDTQLMSVANQVLKGENLFIPKRLIGSAFQEKELMVQDGICFLVRRPNPG